jgi:hypothetical protein
MKKLLICTFFSLILAFSVSTFVYAAEIDTTIPYSGDYLVIVNTSTDGISSQYTGNLAGNIETSNETPTNTPSESSNPIIDTKIENGLTLNRVLKSDTTNNRLRRID